MNETTQSLLNLARETADFAGKRLNEGLGKGVRVENDWGKDIKIELDRMVGEVILEKLINESGCNIVSEELPEKLLDRKSDLTWIVDPIDGSMNLARGIPFYCVSIGLWRGNEPILGVVYDAAHHLTYWGSRETGSFKGDSPIFVSNVHQIDKAVIATGFPVYSSLDDESVYAFISKVRDFKKVRLFGSAAMSIIMVAQGSIEAYHENNIALWDVGGAIPILLSAGGKCSNTAWRDQYLLNVFASNGRIPSDH